MRFVADADRGISFFLSIAGQPFVEVLSGDIVPIPGTADVDVTGVALDPEGTGLLGTQLPVDLYPASLNVTDASGATMPLAPGLALNAPGSENFANKYITYIGTNLYITHFDAAVDIGKTFNVTYTSGPASVPIVLHAQIITENRATTPVFSGATFQEA